MFCRSFCTTTNERCHRHIYELFEPSDVLSEPYVIVCLNAIIADSDEEAQYLSTTQAQVMISITRGRMQPVQPPTDNLQSLLTPREYEMVKQRQNIHLLAQN